MLDIDVETGLVRAGQRAELDRFESEEVEFFHRVRSGYQSRVQQAPERYRVINAGQELVSVQRDIEVVLAELMD